MTSDEPRGSDIWFWLGLVAILGAGAAVFLLRSARQPVRPPPSGPTTTTSSSATTSSTPRTLPPTIPVPVEHPEHPGETVGGPGGDVHVPLPLPPTPATGLPKELAGLIDRLRQACFRGDPEAMTRAQRDMMGYANGDPARALELLEAFRREPDPSAQECIVGAITSDQRLVAEASVVSAFLQIAETDTDSTRRRVALLFLANNPDPSSDLQERLRRLARADTDPGVQVSALHALSMFAEVKPSLALQVNRDLLDIAGAARDPMVRTNALSVFRGHDADTSQIESLGTYLMRDTEGSVRLSAAEALGQVKPEAREAALSQLGTAFSQEDAAEVRRVILMSIVRAGRADARAALERLLPSARASTDDIRDYIEILGTGETNPEAVIQAKAMRDAAREGGAAPPPGTEGH